MGNTYHDPKQIVTPYAFSVDPDLLGYPLATPRRRLAAIIIDLSLAGLISSATLSGDGGAIAVSFLVMILSFWAVRKIKTKGFFKTSFKYISAFFLSWILFGLSFLALENDGPDTPGVVTINSNDIQNASSTPAGEVDWAALVQQGMAAANADSGNEFSEVMEQLGEQLEDMLTERPSNANIDRFNYPEEFASSLSLFATAITGEDSVAYDTLRPAIASLVAKPEIDTYKNRIRKNNRTISDLEDERDAQKEIIDNPSFGRLFKAAANDLGLTFGWVGIYFILSTMLLNGSTPGKRMLKLKTVRLNGKPMTLLYSVERFGGYAAGVFTGLLGFFQMLWDPNRQAIHDKIAGTVVIDTRESKKEKMQHLTDHVLSQENLLHNL